MRQSQAEVVAGTDGRRRRYAPGVRGFRRGLIVVFVAAVAGGLMRLRGKGGVPPTNGGWRELEAPDFR